METIKEYLIITLFWMLEHYVWSLIILFIIFFLIVGYFSFKNAPIMDDDYDI